MRTSATILLAGLLLAAPAAAQDTATDTPATATERVAFVPKQSQTQDLVSRFIGTPVVNPAGDTLGKVNDLVMTPEGQVEVIIIGVGGFLGVGEKNVGVPYDALARTEGDDGSTKLMLNATQGDLTDAPEFLTADNKSLSITKRLRKRASELTEQAKKTYDKAKDRVMDEAEELNQ